MMYWEYFCCLKTSVFNCALQEHCHVLSKRIASSNSIYAVVQRLPIKENLHSHSHHFWMETDNRSYMIYFSGWDHGPMRRCFP